MPAFDYIALKPGSTEEVRGRIEADTERDARSKLRTRGEIPTKLQLVRATGHGLSKYIPNALKQNHSREVQGFTVQLATLIRSGITLTDALRLLAEQNTNKDFANILNLVYQSLVEKGSTFATALGNFPHVFSELYVAMVRAGESTGALPAVLERLANFQKKRMEIESRIRGALVYPMIMVIAGFGIVYFLITYLVPKIRPIFEEKAEALPLATEILLAITDFMQESWWIGAIALLVIIIAFKLVLLTKKGRYAFDDFKLKIPIFGDLIRKGAVSRFCVTLGSLLQSGVRIEQALKIVADVVSNSVVRETVNEVGEHIREGSSIAGPLEKNKIFPKVVTYMIMVGEKAGSEELQEMLDNISESYDLEIQQSADRLTSAFAPLILLVIAGMVVFILAAIILPIMSLNTFAG